MGQSWERKHVGHGNSRGGTVLVQTDRDKRVTRKVLYSQLLEPHAALFPHHACKQRAALFPHPADKLHGALFHDPAHELHAVLFPHPIHKLHGVLFPHPIH